MQIVKSLHSSLLHRCFSYQEKHYFTVSVLWGFQLTNGEPVLEQSLWSSIGESMGNGEIFDTGMPKSNAEFLVHGYCFPPGGRPAAACNVSVEFAGLKKELVVFGDRFWIKSLGAGIGVTDPVPYIKMPISYNRSFGGKDFAKNPVGIGIDMIDVDGEQLQPLPNVEYPAKLIGSPKDRPEPASFSRLDQMAEQRIKRAGTYDQKYVETRMPALPDDLNLEAFNDAATDQWLSAFPKGNEAYEIINMHAEFSRIHGHLPAVRGRCFVEHEVKGEISFKEIQTQLDTVHFLPGFDLGILMHRGTIEITEDDAADIKRILVSHENMVDEKRSVEHYQDQMEKRTNIEESYKYLLNTAPLIPDGCKCGFKIIEENYNEASGNLIQENIKTFTDSKKAELEQMQEQALVQQLEEFKKNGADTKEIENELKKIKDLESAVPEETEQSKKIKAAVSKVSPDLVNPDTGIDMSKVDLKAIDQLKEVMTEIADDQKKAAEQHMKDQIEEARRSGNDYEADKLQSIMDTMALPPVLPRIDKEAFQAQLDEKQALMDAELHKMHSMGMLTKDILDKMENIQQKNKQQMAEAIDKLSESYRLGAHMFSSSRSPHEGQEQQIAERLKNLYQSRGKTAGGDYAYVDLSNLDLSGIDLSGAYLEYADLTNTDLSNANLEKAILSHSKLVNTKFTNASLIKANLGSAIINAADFTGAMLDDVILQNSTINKSIFCENNCAERLDLLMGAKLHAVNFIRTNLHKCIFIDLDFTECDFSESDLSGAVFISPILTNAKFDKADLSGVNFIFAKADKSSYKNSTMINTRFIGGSELNDTDFSSSDLSESNLRDAQLKNAVFNRARMDKTDFGSSNLRYANFDKATGLQVQFNKSNLEHASLQGANFMEGSMYKARLSSASFYNANLYNVNFMGCTVGDTDFTGADLNKTIFKDWRP